MIPYLELETWHIGRHEFPVFLTLVIVAVLVAMVLTVTRGRLYNLPAARLEEMCLWQVVIGFTGAHLLAFAYDPVSWAQVTNPVNLFNVGGIASFGGFLGGLAGMWAFFLCHQIKGRDRWKYLDTTGYVVPFSWIFGRMGCALVHDHPGIRTTSWLGVGFPGGVRYDLGLLEVLFLALQAGVFFVLGRRERAPGFYFAALFVPYGMFRLAIEPLRVDPPRFFGFTIDQYAATGLVLAGIAVWFRVVRRDAVRNEEG